MAEHLKKGPVSDAIGGPCFDNVSSRASRPRAFAPPNVLSAGRQYLPQKMLDELWRGDWRMGLALLKKRGDPSYDELETICSEIMDLELFEKELGKTYKLASPLDSIALRQHCENIRSEKSGDEIGGNQKHQWLQKLDQLHCLRKDRINILTLLTERYSYRPEEIPGHEVVSDHETTKGPSIWAVLIGINNYQEINPLRGAVRDTEMIKQYLESDLCVPSNHIRVLTDANATRMAILSALYAHLRDNSEIQRGDAILIHYSGHGASYTAQEFFKDAAGSIEAICPVDRGAPDGDQGIVLDISDREINIFLAELSSIKGDNITLTLDCCYASGASRSVSDSDVQSRDVNPLTHSLEKMLLAAQNYPHKRFACKSPLAGDWKPDLSTHVVLAACQDYERAWEGTDGKGGDFTIALLKALRLLPMATSTYADVIKHIGFLPRQTPWAVGTHVNRVLFTHGPAEPIIPGPKAEAEMHLGHDSVHPLSSASQVRRHWMTKFGWDALTTRSMLTSSF